LTPSRAIAPDTSQFVVRTYPNPKGVRVVIDGITDFDVEGGQQVEPRAREEILRRLESFLPHRPAPDPEPGLGPVLFFDIVLERTEARHSPQPL